MVIPTDPKLAHLGGYVEGGDPATYYPDLWKWFVETLMVRSVIDVGCGDGVALKYFRDTLGCSRTLTLWNSTTPKRKVGSASALT
jgi:hypothetical protein